MEDKKSGIRFWTHQDGVEANRAREGAGQARPGTRGTHVNPEGIDCGYRFIPKASSVQRRHRESSANARCKSGRILSRRHDETGPKKNMKTWSMGYTWIKTLWVI